MIAFRVSKLYSINLCLCALRVQIMKNSVIDFIDRLKGDRAIRIVG